MMKIEYRKAIEQDIPKMIELWKEFIDFHKARDPFFSRSKDGPENFEMDPPVLEAFIAEAGV